MSPNLDPITCPYPIFVDGLFVKPADQSGRLAHAAVGMIGEAIELQYADSRANLVEELGDYEFYLQAYWNNYDADAGTRFKAHYGAVPRDMPDAFQILVKSSADVLDLTKKVWIYGKPLPDVAVKLEGHLVQCRIALTSLYMYLGMEHRDIILANREKLVKRYPGASYSDQAAQERADKKGE